MENEIQTTLKHLLAESANSDEVGTTMSQYTINYAIPQPDGKTAKVYSDHPNSKKSLNKVLELAEQLSHKHPTANIWATKWNSEKMDGHKDLYIQENWNFELVSEAEITNDKIIIDAGVVYKKNEQSVIQSFYDYIKTKLDVGELPQVHIVETRKNGMTYGAFTPSTNEIMVYGKNRGLADVLRTMAHELVHSWQKIEGRIPTTLKGRDPNLESEANSLAGDLVYMFGMEHPEIYELGDSEKSI